MRYFTGIEVAPANTTIIASKCAQPELRCEDAQGTSFTSIHRRSVTVSKRSKYTSASKGKDSGAYGGMGRNV